MSRLLDVAVETPWAITEDYLRVILEVAARRLEGDVTVELPDVPEPAALAARTGERLDGASRVAVRGGVAVVPVIGPIFRRANLFTEISGATSLELLSRDLRTAIEDDSVEAIALDVDSPGGEANGVSEMADMVYAARDQLPVVAFIGDLGASGAYWIASAADRVVASDTALVGSIGVRKAFVDTTERDLKEGVRTIEFVSSQSPNKSLDPTDGDDRAEIQQVVDDLADVFIAKVARNRGVSRETVLEDFGQGGVMVGERAVEAGLVDRIGTFEGVIETLQDRIAGDRRPGGLQASEERTMADSDQGSEPQLTDFEPSADELREAFPEAAAEIESAGREEGAEDERERITAILDLEVTDGHEEVIEEAVGDPEATADSVSRRILARQSEQRKAALDARKADEEELDAPEPDAGTEEGMDGVEKEVGALLQAAGATGVRVRSTA